MASHNSRIGVLIFCDRRGSSAWGDQRGAINRADEVTLSRKGAKSRRRAGRLRSTRTKVRARVGQVRKPRADLEQQLEKYRRELAEAREEHTATSEVLRVISRSPNQLQPVLDSIVATAAELCHADFAMIHTLEHGRFRLVAANKVEANYIKWLARNPPGADRGSISGRVCSPAPTR
jgi:chromosome segregation ATPase